MKNYLKSEWPLPSFELSYKPYGSHAILIEWPQEITKNILWDILLFKEKIVSYNSEVIVEIINTYNSLTILYDTTIENIYNEISHLTSLYDEYSELKIQERKRWKIPVCYDKEFGIDMHEISNHYKLTKEEIIELHAGTSYTVYFIGFIPGFLYLGGLPNELHIPRKANPRIRIPKGSVAIGGSQTGIYPVDSPGGWHIIGRSPISFFDKTAQSPCFASPGDEIIFDPVSLNDYYRIENKVRKKRYNLEEVSI